MLKDHFSVTYLRYRPPVFQMNGFDQNKNKNARDKWIELTRHIQKQETDLNGSDQWVSFQMKFRSFEETFGKM